MELPLGIRLTVNRWQQSLAIAIHMRQLAGGQYGQCGNFNGVVADDTQVGQRVPMEQQLLVSSPSQRTGGPTCGGSPWDAFDLTFDNMSHNNFGGKGTDGGAETIVYTSAAEY